MKDLNVRTILHEELRRIAPDVDLHAINPNGVLREECDIDSMDFLTLVTALHQRLGIEIPELDYPKLITLNGAISYLERRIAAA